MTVPSRRTGDDWRALASEARQRAAHPVLGDMLNEAQAEEYELWAQLADVGYWWQFKALFSAEGVLLPAREGKSRFGWAWIVQWPGHGPRWVRLSDHRSGEQRLARDLRKGFALGTVRQLAEVSGRGANTGERGLAIVPVEGAPRRIVESIDMRWYEDREV